MTSEGESVVEIPEGAVAVTLTGTPKEMVLAGFRLGIEHAAKIIAVCTDRQTDAALSDATPRQCFEVAAGLVRDQGGAAITALERRPSDGDGADPASPSGGSFPDQRLQLVAGGLRAVTVQLRGLGDDAPPVEVAVCSWPTASAGLVITPGVQLRGDGVVVPTGGLRLTHAGTGLAVAPESVAAGADYDQLLDLASRLSGFDWSFATAASERYTADRDRRAEVIRQWHADIQDADEAGITIRV